VKVRTELAVTPPTMTLIPPVVVEGTVAVMSVSDQLTIAALVKLSVTVLLP
jgi:hypothetical protein